ncbi:hypothetical protein CHELA41_24160 [Hyphomicrobiales bacterium]|nr:hypothetical protein CHELA41_24160 [Hyphomicrobiales bacterium]
MPRNTLRGNRESFLQAAGPADSMCQSRPLSDSKDSPIAVQVMAWGTPNKQVRIGRESMHVFPCRGRGLRLAL